MTDLMTTSLSPLSLGECRSAVGAEEMFATRQGLLVLKQTPRYCVSMSFTVPSGCYALVTRQRSDLDYMDEDGNTHAVWPAGLHFPYPPWVGISYLITKQSTVFYLNLKGCRTKDNIAVDINVLLTFRIMGDPDLGEDTNLVRKFVYELSPGGLEEKLRDTGGEIVRNFVRLIDHTEIYGIRNDVQKGLDNIADASYGLYDLKSHESLTDEEYSTADDTPSQIAPNIGSEENAPIILQTGKKPNDAVKTLNERFNPQGIEILSVHIKHVLLPKEVLSQMEEGALSISTKAEERILQEDVVQNIRMEREIQTIRERSSAELLREDKAATLRIKSQKVQLNNEMTQAMKSVTAVREELRDRKQKINTRTEYEIQSVLDKKAAGVSTIELKTKLLITEQIANTKKTSEACLADASLSSAKVEAEADRLLAETEGKTVNWRTHRDKFITDMKKIRVFNKLASNENLILNSTSDESTNLIVVADRILEQNSGEFEQPSPTSVAAEVAVLEQIRPTDAKQKFTFES